MKVASQIYMFQHNFEQIGGRDRLETVSFQLNASPRGRNNKICIINVFYYYELQIQCIRIMIEKQNFAEFIISYPQSVTHVQVFILINYICLISQDLIRNVIYKLNLNIVFSLRFEQVSRKFLSLFTTTHKMIILLYLCSIFDSYLRLFHLLYFSHFFSRLFITRGDQKKKLILCTIKYQTFKENLNKF